VTFVHGVYIAELMVITRDARYTAIKKIVPTAVLKVKVLHRVGLSNSAVYRLAILRVSTLSPLDTVYLALCPHLCN